MSAMLVRSIVCSLSLALLFSSSLYAAQTAEQREDLRQLSIKVKKASNLFKQKDYKRCGEAVTEGLVLIEKLAKGADGDLMSEISPIYNKFLKAHAILELEGVELPVLKKLEEMQGKPTEPKPEPGKTAVSFVKDVAPVLNRRCGGCHVRAAKGDFNMVSYKALMAETSEEGYKIVAPGKINNSHLIAVIEDEVMPPNGGGIPATEFATLKSWVASGAKFDGANEEQNLGRLTRGNNNTTMVNQATGKETVSFSRDIAPILTENCNGCHYKAQRVQGGLNFTSFTGLMRGGDSGPIITPSKVMESLLIDKLGPNAPGERMPRRRPPLSDDQMAKITKWIEEGATFDGPDAAQDLGEVASIAKANMSTHEQLTQDRAKLAQKNWKMAMSGVDSQVTETENFYVMGNTGAATLKTYGEKAEELAPKVAAIFKAPADKPLVKGRMTLYVFTQRYDYSEFGKMVERRDIPREWRGHWKYSVVDAYGAIIPARRDEYSVDGLIAQQIAGVYIASIGSSPRWFSEGSARVAASRIAPDDPRIESWNESLVEAKAAMSAPADFMTGKLPPEFADVASYSFMKFLMKKSSNYQKLLAALGNGTSFDDAFASVYGGTPAQATAAWARSARR